MGLVLYHYDVKQSGDPQTRADLRIAPLRDSIYHRLVRAVLNARAPAGHTAALRAGDPDIFKTWHCAWRDKNLIFGKKQLDPRWRHDKGCGGRRERRNAED